MNAHSKVGRGKAAVFKSNRSQAVRIPKEFAFPEDVKHVLIRKVGESLVLTPEASFWDDFFDQGPDLDFPERFPQGEYEERESFDD
jgi:antitoxin VapB